MPWPTSLQVTHLGHLDRGVTALDHAADGILYMERLRGKLSHPDLEGQLRRAAGLTIQFPPCIFYGRFSRVKKVLTKSYGQW